MKGMNANEGGKMEGENGNKGKLLRREGKWDERR